MRDFAEGHGRAAGDHVDAAGAAEGERRGSGPGDDHQGRRTAGGKNHRLREVQVSVACGDVARWDVVATMWAAVWVVGRFNILWAFKNGRVTSAVVVWTIAPSLREGESDSLPESPCSTRVLSSHPPIDLQRVLGVRMERKGYQCAAVVCIDGNRTSYFQSEGKRDGSSPRTHQTLP